MESLKNRITLKTLAEYIQLFVIAHPFERINYSILMAQVNAMLVTKKCKPIHHGYLDFDCFIYSSDIIEKAFIQCVAQYSV